MTDQPSKEQRPHRGITSDWNSTCTDNDCWCWGSEHHNPREPKGRDLVAQLRALPGGYGLLGYTAAEMIELLQGMVDSRDRRIKVLLRPSHEREPPHCKSCACSTPANEAYYAAMNRLTVAMGNPALQWNDGETIESALIDEAARRLSSAHEPGADAAAAMFEAGRQVYGGGWIDHGPDCNEAGCSCGLENWIRRYHTLLKLDISHWPAQPSSIDPADPTHFAFLVKRPRDKEAWATIFTSRDRAIGYEHRASEVVPVRLAQPPRDGQ